MPSCQSFPDCRSAPRIVVNLPRFSAHPPLIEVALIGLQTRELYLWKNRDRYSGNNAYVGGTEHITPLFNAIQYQTVQIIHYKPFDEEEKELVFHPQFLKQYNNRWYIFGMEQEHPDEVWNLALDRIVSIKPTKLPYIKLDIDWLEYFSDIIGVTNYKDAPVEEVHFVVHGKTAHYLYTKPIHESQIPHWNEDGSLDVKLKVKINYELKRLLLSYAADITILSPQSLVDAHKESLRKALEQYQ